MAGTKHDAGKPALALIPPHAEWEVAKAFTYGRNEYGQYNYLEGLDVVRTLSAVKRHINKFLRGQNIDTDSGAHHLGCACAGLMMIMENLVVNGDKVDDRFGYSEPEDELDNGTKPQKAYDKIKGVLR